MWVVKLGGSLLGSEELRQWLDLFVRSSDGRVVIVPGGGIFADAVRESQRQSGVSDAVAHRMAVMAMDQYGRLLAGLNHELVTAETELEIAERGWQHRAIVWLPSRMVLAEETIPANWEVTSDSLAAWLAAKLSATHLILVKSLRPGPSQMPVGILAETGLVDECLENFIVGQDFDTWVLGKKDYAAFDAGISLEQLRLIGQQVVCPVSKGG